MTYFNRYATNQPAVFNLDNNSDDKKFTVDDIVKNKNQSKYGEEIAPIPPGNKNAPETWALL